MSWMPVPSLRVAFRVALCAALGAGLFAIEIVTGFGPLWWAGLLFYYMAANRLVASILDNIADRAHDRFVRNSQACKERPKCSLM